MPNPEGCIDDYNEFDLNFPITFNLTLRYATGELTSTQRNSIETYIINLYDEHKLFFEIEWEGLTGNQYVQSYSNWPNQFPNQDTECDCRIVGDILHSGIDNNGDTASGRALTGKGRFWSISNSNISIAHELGHALGLIHTHGPQQAGIRTEEFVTRSNSGCDCNCLKKGDLVCDTPADPVTINGAPFLNGCNFDSDGVKDNCLSGTEFEDDNNILPQNIMGYYHGCRTSLTSRQNLRIRRKMSLGGNNFKFQSNCEAPEFITSNGLVIDDPSLTIIEENYLFEGDLVINSDVHFKNNSLLFTGLNKISISAGTNVTFENVEIRGAKSSDCAYNGTSTWNGDMFIRSNQAQFTNVTIKSGSVINMGVKSIYFTGQSGSYGLMNLEFSDSFLRGRLEMSNTFGIQTFKNCEFQEYTDKILSLKNIYNLEIRGCTFSVGQSSSSISNNPIEAINSNLKLLDNNGIKNKFNIDSEAYAVKYESSGSNLLSVSNSDFANNKIAIYVDGNMGLVNIENCSFTGSIENSIELYDVASFNINVNTFNDSPNSSAIFLRNNYFQNSNPNVIIDNEVAGYNHGLRSSGDFGGSFGGLTYLCNTFENVDDSNIYRWGDINGQQGTQNAASGNDFSYNGASNGDFFTSNNFGNLLNYFYEDVSNQEPQNFNGMIKVEADNAASCSLTEPNGGSTPLPQERVDILQSLLDGGNTSSLVDLINDNSSTDPILVLTTLLNLSPYVSIEAMTTLLDQSDYYLEAEVANIIAQNSAVIQDNYIAYLVFNSNSFNAQSQSQIESAYYNGDSRIDLENEINFASQLMGEEIFNNVLGAFNSLPINWNNIRTEFEKGVTETYKYQILETYLEEKHWTGAQFYISDLSGQNIIDPIQRAECEKYIDIANIEVKYGELNESLDNMSSADQQILMDIANSYFGVATKKARLLLKHNFGLSFGSFPARTNYNSITFRSLPRNKTKGIERIKIYPNPTTEVINISFEHEEWKNRKVQVELFSTKGKLLTSQTIKASNTTIDLSSFQNGIYFIKFVEDGEVFEQRKLVVNE